MLIYFIPKCLCTLQLLTMTVTNFGCTFLPYLEFFTWSSPETLIKKARKQLIPFLVFFYSRTIHDTHIKVGPETKLEKPKIRRLKTSYNNLIWAKYYATFLFSVLIWMSNLQQTLFSFEIMCYFTAKTYHYDMKVC